MAIARFAASPSTIGGRDSGWPSGPVIPIFTTSFCRRKTSSPFRVHRGHRAQLEGAAEAVHQRLVVAHDGVLVGHEVLETVHALFADEGAHVLAHRFAPPCDRDVEAVIRRGLLRPSAPLPVRVHQRLLRVRDHEVDDARRAAREPGGGAGEEIVGGHRPHERQLHVRVRVDAARDHVLAARVELLGIRGRLRRRVVAYRRDASIDAKHVSLELAVGVDDGAATNEEGIGHFASSGSGIRILPLIPMP
jgi:hypothetical protein